MNNDELLDEFKKEYRRLAKLWHPDHQPIDKKEQATRLMQWLNKVYKETINAYQHVSGMAV